MVLCKTLLGVALYLREYPLSRHFYSAAVINRAFSTTDGENGGVVDGLANDTAVTKL